MNAIIVRLGEILKNNIPLCLLDSMAESAPVILHQAGKSYRTVNFDASSTSIDDLMKAASSLAYDGILFSALDSLDDEEQKRLTIALRNLELQDRGKLIFTANKMEQVSQALPICKIKFSFQFVNGVDVSSLTY